MKNNLIEVNNPDDITEVAIKTKTEIGQIFMKGYNEYYRTIGIENLNMKDRKGNPLTKLSGGKQKAKAQEIIKQYTEIINRPDLNKYAIQIADIFEMPHYIEKEDGRGKNGFYIDRILPTLTKNFSERKNNIFYTNINELSKISGIVNENFKSLSLQQINDFNSDVTWNMLNEFYFKCKPEQESIICKVLDRLQNSYSVLSYYKNFHIITENGEFTSSKEDEIIIRKTQRNILKEFNIKTLQSIHARKLDNKFYSRVCELINEEYGTNWIKYYHQIQIIVDIKGLQEISNYLIFDDKSLERNKLEVAERFQKRIQKKMEYALEYNKRKIEKWEDEIKEMRELNDLGMDYTKEIELSKPYELPDNYMDIQKELIAIFLKQSNNQQ